MADNSSQSWKHINFAAQVDEKLQLSTSVDVSYELRPMGISPTYKGDLNAGASLVLDLGDSGPWDLRVKARNGMDVRFSNTESPPVIRLF